MDDLSIFFNPPIKTHLRKSEQTVLSLVAQGFSNQAISKQLFISEKTVEIHIHNIYKKLETIGIDFQERHKRVYLVNLFSANNNSHIPPRLRDTA